MKSANTVLPWIGRAMFALSVWGSHATGGSGGIDAPRSFVFLLFIHDNRLAQG